MQFSNYEREYKFVAVDRQLSSRVCLQKNGFSNCYIFFSTQSDNKKNNLKTILRRKSLSCEWWSICSVTPTFCWDCVYVHPSMCRVRSAGGGGKKNLFLFYYIRTKFSRGVSKIFRRGRGVYPLTHPPRCPRMYPSVPTSQIYWVRMYGCTDVCVIVINIASIDCG